MKTRLAFITLLITLGMTAWLSTTYAQEPQEAQGAQELQDVQEPQQSREEFECEKECKHQAQLCMDDCAEYPNPLECDRVCNRARDECMCSCH